jgi:hypothetical protein
MKLKFELNELDLLKFNQFHHWYSPNKKLLRLKNRLIFSIPLLLMPFILTNYDHNETINNSLLLNNLFIGGILGCIGWFIAKPYTIYTIKKSLIKFINQGKNQDLIGERTMIFNENEIEMLTTNTNSKISISIIEKIEFDNDYHYIYINLLTAYIIPKRVLKNEIEILEFEKILNNYKIACI